MAEESWQSAWVEVLPDFSNFRRSANSEMTSVLGAAGASGGAAAGTAMNGGILSAIPKIAGPLVAAFAALGIGRLIGEAIGSGIRFGLDGIDLASDLAETRQAVQQVFGESAAGIEQFASTAAQQLGQTQQQALDAARTFGAFGIAAGLTGDDLTTFSTDLVGLATDLASFNNTDVDVAIQAIGAALRGENEPIRQFQVLLDDAALKAEAFRLGIYDGTGALTQQQRVLAAQAQLFAQTSLQQGDFLRTSDGLAGQQKILAASFEEAQTKLGEALLPTMLLFTQLANDTLVPLLNDVVEQVGPQLASALEESAPAFVELVQAIAPLIPDLVKLSVDLLPPLLQLFTIAARNTADFFGALAALSGLLSGDISLEEYGKRVQDLAGWLGDLMRWITSVIQGFQGLTRDVISAVSSIGSTLYNSGRSLIQGFINGINSMFTPVRNAVGGLMDFVAGFFPHSPAEHGPFSGAGWRAIGDSGKAILDEFTSGLGGSPAIFSGVRIPSVGGLDPVSGSATSIGQFSPNLMRALERLAEREVVIDVDGETLARGTIGGSARLAALGAN